MEERITALGEYINQGLGKKINFKGIKSHPVARGFLFSYGTDDYIISEKNDEVLRVAFELSQKKASDYPSKLAKKYTHRKYEKANTKKPESIVLKGKKYFIIKL